MEIRTSIWENFERLDFLYKLRDVIVVKPDIKNLNGKVAVYTEYFSAFPKVAVSLVKNGYHLIYVRNINRWGIDEDQHIRSEFMDWLSGAYGLSPKGVMIGMSCGGLHAVNFAHLHPENVSVLYLDAPVMNLLSCPLAYGRTNGEENLKQEFLAAVNMTESEMLSFRGHPIDRMQTLLDNKIRVVMVYGDSDEIVPYHENGALLEKFYKENGGIIKVIGKKGCGHHPHGLADPAEIVNFIIENDRA